MLKIEDVKAGDELVCIDRDGYINQDNGHARIRRQILSKPIVIFEITKNGVSLTRISLQIPLDSLKFFKKKEQSQQYTFDDLIDVAVQAYKDGVLSAVDIESEEITIYGKNFQSSICDDSANEGIKHIQSLYKENFVIEFEEDIKRIKKGADITLSNSNKSKVSVIDYDENTLKVANWDYFLEFFSLKGATVEQERGRDD